MSNYDAIPDFGQFTEYVTQGPLVNSSYSVIVNRISLSNLTTPDQQGEIALLKPQTLETLKGDYAKVTALRTVSDLQPAEVTAVKTAVGTGYHSDVVALSVATPNPVAVVNTLAVAVVRPTWKVGLAVTLGQVYFYAVDKNLYEVIQAHTTQSTWMPPIAKALFKRFYEPSDSPWPWVQPTGAHDAYPVGARVTYGGYTWQNTIPANVWQPGVTGWTNLTPPPVTPVWAVGVAYKVNDQVTYNGSTYKCLQAHTSIATWTPTAAVSLWTKV